MHKSITILQANQTVHDISMSKKEHKTVCKNKMLKGLPQ